MSWEELYPIVCDQAYYAVLRYDPRRKDKIRSLSASPTKNICMMLLQVKKSKNKIINASLLSVQKKLTLDLSARKVTAEIPALTFCRSIEGGPMLIQR